MLDRFANAAVNEATFGTAPRERTVPIRSSITPVPGYPRKLVVFKMAASRFWQVRCWIKGKTYKRSAQTQSLRVAQSFARTFYEQLLAQSHGFGQEGMRGVVSHDSSSPIVQQRDDQSSTVPQDTFGALAAQMFAAEQARVDRGEFTRGSLMVLRNRLDSHLLPRWGTQPITAIGYREIMEFVDFMSKAKSSTTISQYIIAIRKVFHHAVRVGALDKLPEFPKVKIKTASRGAFTPTEYWRILRTARSLRGKPHPDSKHALRKSYKLVYSDYCMPPDLAWAVGFMVNSEVAPEKWSS